MSLCPVRMTLVLLATALPCAACTGTPARSLLVQSPPVEAATEAAGAPVRRFAPRTVSAPAAFTPRGAGGPLRRQGRASPWRLVSGDALPASVTQEADRRRSCLLRARRRANLFAGGVVVGMAAYGVAVFGAGSSGFHKTDDGWFGEFTGSGGADKLGHAVSAHIQTAVYAAVYRAFGLPRREAALRAAGTAFATQLALEVADGFSADHGFSWNDVAANAAGCLFGYFHETAPGFARIFDLRWEYVPSERVRSGEDSEITTDYEGSSYLLAANVGAIYSRRANPLDFLDVQVGYETRYYNNRQARSERRPFVGLGLNLPAVCRRLRLPVLGRFFEYYQPPGLSLRWSTNLND